LAASLSASLAIGHLVFDEFAEQTIVAILHRGEQLHRFDRVAVIENGKLVGIGKPSDVNLET
jgi:ABC-type transport system involved in cytochrome bd biosynthesis fused ATPase/permease subunit